MSLRDQISLTRAQNRNLKLRSEVHQLQNAVYGGEDRMQNSLTSLIGSFAQSELTSFNDLAYNNIYAPLTINWTMLMFMYKTHGVIQTAIDMPVQDALRGGLDIHSDEMDETDIGNLMDYLENHQVLTTLKTAEIWTRLFGGGAIIINAGDPAKPLNPANLRDMRLYAANRWELQSNTRFSEYYTFYGERIHNSHVLTMAGKDAPYIMKQILQNWGMSEMERMVEPMNIFLRTQNVIYDILKEAKVDVYQFERFNSQLASNKGTQQLINRVQLMNRAKSTNNAILLDKNDIFEQKQLTFAGLAEIWKENRINLASTMRIPMTKLFGLSASGFSSGEDDIENYNAMVESEVREHIKTVVRQLLDYSLIALFGDTFDFAWKFKPLRVLSSTDEEAIKTQKHARYKADYDSGLLTPQEYMGLLQKEEMMPITTDVANGAEPIDMEPEVEDDELTRD